MLISCVNCSYNPLQTDGIGNGAGYCTSHGKVLHQPTSLTCGRLLRKDLLLPRAKDERSNHAQTFSMDRIALWRQPATDAGSLGHVDDDVTVLRRDPIGRIVTDYARAKLAGGSKMMFLGQLNPTARAGDARAELAQHSLGRTYVNHCVEVDGRTAWTAGNYLVEWTKELLPIEPRVDGDHLVDGPVPHARLLELARWEIVSMRLQFLADIATLAPDDEPIAALRELPERAARACRDIAFAPLMKWAATRGWELTEQAFPTAAFLTRQQALTDAPPTSSKTTSAASDTAPTWRRSPPRSKKRPPRKK